MPLLIYIGGLFLPATVALVRGDLMPAVGITAYATFFWAGPFASAAAVFWSDWSAGWRTVWVLLAPTLAGLILGAIVFMVRFD